MGVRGRKSAKTRVVKIIGKTKNPEYRAKGVYKNTLTGMVDTKLPLRHAYARMGLAADAGLSKEQTANIQETLPSHAKREELPEIVPAKRKLQVISESEHVFVEQLVEKYDLDFKAMSRDRKLNPFQHTAKKLRKMVTKVVKMEKAMFPEQFKGLFDDDKLVGDVSDNEW